MQAKGRGALAAVVVMAAAVGVGGVAGCARKERAAPSAVAMAAAPADHAGSAKAEGGRPRAGSLREIRVDLEVELPSRGAAHAALAALGESATARGGFVASSAFGRDDQRSHTVLRVPPEALAEVRRAASAAGAIVRDQETTTDVTDAIADVDARLRAGRTEETRLLALVEQRTGSVADVLAAERALADVRDRIERLDAESHAAHGRVDLATVDVWILQASTPIAEETVGSRLIDAAHDGTRAAGAVSLALATGALRGGPSAAIFGMLVGALALLVRRWRGRRVVAFPP